MSDPQIIQTLTTKRNQIESRIEAWQREIEAARCDLAAINATMALFKQDGVIRPTMSIARMFKRGELFAMCKDAIEAAGEAQDTRQLARAVAQAKGLDAGDRVIRKALALSIVNVMTRQAKRGAVAVTGRRSGVKVWARA
jgi:hypothetical protein